MTNDEALNLRTFNHYCNCGGGSKPLSDKHPHQQWCAQYTEYEEWIEALDRMGITIHDQLKHNLPHLYE